MVLGLWMQRLGVGLRGDSGPNAPIVLGTNNFSLSDGEALIMIISYFYCLIKHLYFKVGIYRLRIYSVQHILLT